jgi:hypothetical protein
VNELQLTENVVFVMRSADWDVEVLRRGARILGQCIEQPENIPSVSRRSSRGAGSHVHVVRSWLFVSLVGSIGRHASVTVRDRHPQSRSRFRFY